MILMLNVALDNWRVCYLPAYFILAERIAYALMTLQWLVENVVPVLYTVQRNPNRELVPASPTVIAVSVVIHFSVVTVLRMPTVAIAGVASLAFDVLYVVTDHVTPARKDLILDFIESIPDCVVFRFNVSIRSME